MFNGISSIELSLESSHWGSCTSCPNECNNNKAIGPLWVQREVTQASTWTERGVKDAQSGEWGFTYVNDEYVLCCSTIVYGSRSVLLAEYTRPVHCTVAHVVHHNIDAWFAVIVFAVSSIVHLVTIVSAQLRSWRERGNATMVNAVWAHLQEGRGGKE